MTSTGTDFHLAMKELLRVFRNELNSKVTSQEMKGLPRFQFLAKPGVEYSDHIYKNFYPRREVAQLVEATNFLKNIKAVRTGGAPMNAGPPANFNFADFSSALSELIQIFRQDLGGSVTPKELGPNTRLMCLTQQGLEHSDALYKEFYPRKETGEIKRSIVVLKEIAQARLNSVYQPNRRPMSNSSPTQMSSSAAANDNFSLNDFSKAMLEILRIFKDDLGGRVTNTELGPNVRFAMLARSGVEYSELLFQEFYPNRETAELKRGIVVLKEIVEARKANVYKRRPTKDPAKEEYSPPSQTPYSAKSVPIVMGGGAQPVVNVSKSVTSTYSFVTPSKNVVITNTIKNMVKDSVEETQKTPYNKYKADPSQFMVFDYDSFTMRPISAFI